MYCVFYKFLEVLNYACVGEKWRSCAISFWLYFFWVKMWYCPNNELVHLPILSSNLETKFHIACIAVSLLQFYQSKLATLTLHSIGSLNADYFLWRNSLSSD